MFLLEDSWLSLPLLVVTIGPARDCLRLYSEAPCTGQYWLWGLVQPLQVASACPMADFGALLFRLSACYLAGRHSGTQDVVTGCLLWEPCVQLRR
jgi:hypothetical protein